MAAFLVDLRTGNLNAVARACACTYAVGTRFGGCARWRPDWSRPTWGHRLGIAAALAGFVLALVVAALGLGVPAVVVDRLRRSSAC